jgi:hypothetical protein
MEYWNDGILEYWNVDINIMLFICLILCQDNFYDNPIFHFLSEP